MTLILCFHGLIGSSIPQFRAAHFEGSSAETGGARKSRNTKDNIKVSQFYEFDHFNFDHVSWYMMVHDFPNVEITTNYQFSFA